MDLLPKSKEEFRQKEYWDNFFKKRGRKAFEWYGEYGELCGILHKYIKPKDNVLVVGCGNSTLSADLYDVGYKSLTSIDLSDIVIRQMRQQHEQRRPDLKFEKMDVTAMEYEDNAFSVALDKGTLDAMMTDDTAEVVEKIDKMFSEIARVLRVGGRYICISLLQPHILNHVVEWFQAQGWPIRILRCKEAEDSKPPEDRVFPVFAIVATKFKKMNDRTPVLEISLSSNGQITRVKSPSDLIGSVRGVQQFAAVRAGAAKGRLFQGDARQADVSLDLKTENSEKPKYSLYLVDRDRPGRIKFAAFIVPQGRQTEWLFSTAEGRRQLAESADCQRMVVVHLQRDHVFQSMEQIQSELSGYVMELSPSDLPSGAQVPFLSLGQESGVGARTERCKGKSQFSGEYIVEDVEVNGDTFRRLIFLDNPNITQSEVKIINVRGKNKKLKKQLDLSYLGCTHHSLMIGSLGLYHPLENFKCLIIGLGGGGLPTFLAMKFPQIKIDVVEIDPAIVRVAQDQFGFKPNDNLRIITDDGLRFICDAAAKANAKYNIIMFDVDNKDSSVGMSCPPRPFVDRGFLAKVQQCLSTEGMFVLNLVCRDPLLRSDVVQDIHTEFRNIVSYRVPEEVNEILYCTNDEGLNGKKVDMQHPVVKAFENVNGAVGKSGGDDFLDLTESMKILRIV